MVTSLVHAAHPGPHRLAEVRDLCDLAFDDDDDYDDATFQHALGGTHALVRHDNVLVAHGAVVLRRLCIGGRWLRCAWILWRGPASVRVRMGSAPPRTRTASTCSPGVRSTSTARWSATGARARSGDRG